MSGEPNRKEDGFTLIELLIGIMISGLIMSALTTGFIVTMKGTVGAHERFVESHDAQLLATYFTSDVQSADPAMLNQSMDSAGPDYVPKTEDTGCADPSPSSGDNVLRLRWTEATTKSTLAAFAANYRIEQPDPLEPSWRLVRQYCTASGAVPTDADTLLGGDVPTARIVAHALADPSAFPPEVKVTSETVSLKLYSRVAEDGDTYGYTFTARMRSAPSTTPSFPIGVTVEQKTVQADPTSTLPVLFTVTFSEPVTGFAAADVQRSGTATGGSVAVTGSGATYEISVTGLTSDGTVIVTIPAGAAANAALEGSAASTSSDNSVLYDAANPSVLSIVRADPNPTGANPVRWTVTFRESVTGVGAGDFDLVETLAGPTTITSVIGSGTTWTVTASTGNPGANGTIRLDLDDDDTIRDVLNKPLGGAGNGNGNLTGEQYIIDRTGPTVTINQKVGQLDPTSTMPLLFTVIFGEPVTGFDATDVTLSGTALGAVPSVTGSGATYEVAVTGISAQGTVVASIPADRATDSGGSGNLASTSADNSVTYDTADPTVVSINRLDSNPTNLSSVRWTVTFSENVTGVDAADFIPVRTSLTGPSSVSSVTGSGTTYIVTATTGNGSGTLGLNLVDNDTIRDLANKPLGGTGNGNGNLTGQVYSVDRSGPTITALQLKNNGVTQGKIEKGDQIIVTFSERLAVSTLCSTWSGDTTDQDLTGDNDVTVTVKNAGGGDSVSIATAGCTSNFGSLDLDSRDHVTADTLFGGSGADRSTVRWDATTFQLTITFGGTTGTTGTAAASRPTYSPSPNLTDSIGNPGSASFRIPTPALQF